MRFEAMQTEGWLLVDPGIGLRILTSSPVRVAPFLNWKRVTPWP
jgi:hypothetical protein